MISPDIFNAQQQDLVVAAVTSQVPDTTLTEALARFHEFMSRQVQL